MRRSLAATLVALCCIFVGCTPAETPADTVTALTEEEADSLLSHASFFAVDETIVYHEGETHHLVTAPFLHDGVLFAPLGEVLALFDGTVLHAGDVYYMQCDGNTAAVMTDYNVLLFNTEAVIMEAAPLLKGDVLCLPLSAIARITARPFCRGPSSRLFAVGADGPLTEAMFCELRPRLRLPAVAETVQTELASLSEAHGYPLSDLRQAAVERVLWLTDANGTPHKLWIDDGNTLHREICHVTVSYPADTLLIVKENVLTSVQGERYGASPELVSQQELRDMTGRFAELRAAADVNDDDTARQLADSYRRYLCDGTADEALTADRTVAYQTLLRREDNDKDAWKLLVSRAEVGDFLLLSSAQADDRYGYFNHAALILSVDHEAGALHLLHARNAERGVGSDLPMDHLTYDAFTLEDYYTSYDVVFLCHVDALSRESTLSMTEAADRRYAAYRFGYGGRQDVLETNCTELITDSYREVGISLTDDVSDTLLKAVLKGNSGNLIPIPDDLLFSTAVTVTAVWHRTT